MEKPILLGVDGESRGIVEKYKAGLYFEPENEKAFLNAIERLKNDKELYQKCQGGCHKLAQYFDRKKLAKQMLDFIQQQVN